MCLRALIFKLLDARARLAPRPGAERPLAATAGAERGTPAPEPRVTPSAATPAPSEAQIRERIAHRAYELFEQRGGEPGHDAEDWARAEREVRAALGSGR